MALGPLTRQALLDAGVAEDQVRDIEEGAWRWELRRAPSVGVSANLEVARAAAQEATRRKDFIFKLWSPKPAAAHLPRDMATFEQLVENAAGARVAEARRYEEALAQRAGAVSTLFPPGTLEDWTNTGGAESWDTLAFEFRRAARAVAATHRRDAPAPVLVLLQLCRHHFELSLKAIIIAGERPAKSKPPHGHPLAPLWNRAEPIIQRAWKVMSDDDLRLARDIVLELEKVDPRATATRYPEDEKGDAFARPPAIRSFSIGGFMEQFERAAEFLSMAALWIHIESDSRRDPPASGEGSA